MLAFIADAPSADAGPDLEIQCSELSGSAVGSQRSTSSQPLPQTVANNVSQQAQQAQAQPQHVLAAQLAPQGQASPTQLLHSNTQQCTGAQPAGVVVHAQQPGASVQQQASLQAQRHARRHDSVAVQPLRAQASQRPLRQQPRQAGPQQEAQHSQGSHLGISSLMRPAQAPPADVGRIASRADDCVQQRQRHSVPCAQPQSALQQQLRLPQHTQQLQQRQSVQPSERAAAPRLTAPVAVDQIGHQQQAAAMAAGSNRTVAHDRAAHHVHAAMAAGSRCTAAHDCATHHVLGHPGQQTAPFLTSPHPQKQNERASARPEASFASHSHNGTACGGQAYMPLHRPASPPSTSARQASASLNTLPCAGQANAAGGKAGMPQAQQSHGMPGSTSAFKTQQRVRGQQGACGHQAAGLHAPAPQVLPSHNVPGPCRQPLHALHAPQQHAHGACAPSSVSCAAHGPPDAHSVPVHQAQQMHVLPAGKSQGAWPESANNLSLQPVGSGLTRSQSCGPLIVHSRHLTTRAPHRWSSQPIVRTAGVDAAPQQPAGLARTQ